MLESICNSLLTRHTCLLGVKMIPSNLILLSAETKSPQTDSSAPAEGISSLCLEEGLQAELNRTMLFELLDGNP